MFDGALPVFGRLSAGHELELIRREPSVVEEDTRASGTHLQSVQVKGPFILSTLNVNNHILSKVRR